MHKIVAVSLSHLIAPKDAKGLHYATKFAPKLARNLIVKPLLHISEHGLRMCDQYSVNADVEIYYISGSMYNHKGHFSDKQVAIMHKVAKIEFPLKVFKNYDALSKELDYTKIVSADPLDVLIANGSVAYSQPMFDNVDVSDLIKQQHKDKMKFFEKMGWIK